MRRAHAESFSFPLSSFPFRRSPTRRAITLIEVLISMGVLTIGILGVAALFPVGGHLARRGDIYDRADAAAAAALNDAVTRGLVNPENWVSYELPENDGTQSYHRLWGGAFRGSARTDNTFARPFASDLRQRLASSNFLSATDASGKEAALNHQVGSIFFVDPIGVASSVASPATNAAPAAARATPASYNQAFRMGVARTAPVADTTPISNWWSPWSGTSPIARVSVGLPSVNHASGVTAVSLPMADRLTSVGDDLSVDLDDQADIPARQNMLSTNVGGTQIPLTRQASQNFSYLLSVVPLTPEGRSALAYGGRGQPYDVSAVVFDRRPLNRFDNSPGAAFNGIDTLVRSERFCQASVVAGGPNGGELRLYQAFQKAGDAFWRNGIESNLPWKDLKAGSYVLVMGSHPNASYQRPRLFAQWYRVTSLEETELAPTTQGVLGPTLALRGPDWPWDDSMISVDTDSELLQTYIQPGTTAVHDDLRVLILDGVVAVHTRTMRLDAGTAWEE